MIEFSKQRREIFGFAFALMALGLAGTSAQAESKRPEDRGRGGSGGQGGDHGDDHTDGGDDHGDDHADGGGDDHDHSDGDDHGARGRGKGKGPKYRGGRSVGVVPGRRGQSLEQAVFKKGGKRWIR